MFLNILSAQIPPLTSKTSQFADQIMTRHKFVTHKQKHEHKYKIGLQKYERENIADALVSQAFAKGQEVVKQASQMQLIFVDLGCQRLIFVDLGCQRLIFVNLGCQRLIFVDLGCQRPTNTKAKPFKCSLCLSLSLPLAHFSKLQNLFKPLQFALQIFQILQLDIFSSSDSPTLVDAGRSG